MKIETILDALLVKAEKLNQEIVIDNASEFVNNDGNSSTCAVVHNPQSRKFAIISTEVKEYPGEPICVFTFNGQLYDYAKKEGFSRDDMVNKKGVRVLKKVELEDFFNHLLNN